MDFILGSKETEKQTCLLEMANKYIIDNEINKSNGFILLFTPPHSNQEMREVKDNNQNKKVYNFNQYLTTYMPNSKENLDLIKTYFLKTSSQAFGLIDNFRLISNEKGVRLVLIDDVTSIINPWVNELLKNQLLKAKQTEEREKITNQDNILLIYNEVFQQFLSKVTALQKDYQIPCFITLNLDISDHMNFRKNSTKIFNAIYPFVRTIHYLSKVQGEDSIIFNELQLRINLRTDKIFYEIKKEEENKNKSKENENDYKSEIFFDRCLSEYIEKKDKKNKNDKNEFNYDEWKKYIKDGIGTFVNNINQFLIMKKQMDERKEENEKSSSYYTQMDK